MSTNTKTVKRALNIKGVDPQHLVEKIIRERIYENPFYKDKCNTLSFDCIYSLAKNLCYIGGIFSNTKPSPFLCLLLKLLQIQPAILSVKSPFTFPDNNKYVLALFSLYLRLVLPSNEIQPFFKPLLNDYRKLRRRTTSGIFEIITMDEYIDSLLNGDRVCDIILPRICKKIV